MNQERKAGEPSALIWLWLSVFVIAFDLITKQLAENFLTYGQPVPVFPVFDLTLLYNPGAAFSFLAGEDGWQRWFFIALALSVSVALVVWLCRLTRAERVTAFGLALLIGGALGNVWDRMWPSRKMVVDFLDFYWAGWHWPAFNIADIAICCGAAALMYATFTESDAASARSKH